MRKFIQISIGLILSMSLFQVNGLVFASQVDNDLTNMQCSHNNLCFLICNISQRNDVNKSENIAALPDKFVIETDFGFTILEKDTKTPLYLKNQSELPEIRAGPLID